MNYTREDLEAKSESELAKIVKSASPNVNTDMFSPAALIDMILTEAVEESKRTTKNKPKAVRPEVRKRIIVHNQEGPEASPFVKVQVNGNMVAIPREQEVVVSESVLDVLTNAVRTDSERTANGEYIDRSSRRFPFTVLGDAA